MIQIILKWYREDMDDSRKQAALHIIQALWCVHHPSSTLLAIQQHLVAFIQTAKQSLVPQDKDMTMLMFNALRQETVQPYLKEGLHVNQDLTQPSQLQIALFLSEYLMVLPDDFSQLVLKAVWKLNTLATSSQYALLSLLKRVLNQIKERSVQSCLIEYLRTVDTVELIEIASQCLVSHSLDSQIASFLRECVLNCSCKDETIQRRSILTLGFVYQSMERPFYFQLVRQSSSFEYQSIALQLERICLSADPLLQTDSLASYYRILFHNPREISSAVIDRTITVLFTSSPH